MENTTTPINLHQMVLDRIEEHLGNQMEAALDFSLPDKLSKELSAIKDVLSYPPIAYLTKSPEYLSDIESLDQASVNWIINFVNYVTMDWTMMIRTINGDDDYYESFIGSFVKSIESVAKTSITMEGYSDRLDTDKVKDPVALTYYLMATAYRNIALKLGAADVRASSKSVS